MNRALCLTAILLLTVLTPRHSLAAPQKHSGEISGVVLGPDDKPVPHASVTYQSSAGVAPHAVHADARGRFLISHLRTDNYDLRASGEGVFSDWEKNVAVKSGYTKSVTLRLVYANDVPKAYVKKPKQ
jgi:Carboxypeptidase regulatory-like domain